MSKNISDSNFLDITIENINNLIKLTESEHNLITLLDYNKHDDHKDRYTYIPFCLRNYRKWLKVIKELKTLEDFKDKSIETLNFDDLKKTTLKNGKKITKGLLERFKQIKEANIFNDIEALEQNNNNLSSIFEETCKTNNETKNEINSTVNDNNSKNDNNNKNDNKSKTPAKKTPAKKTTDKKTLTKNNIVIKKKKDNYDEEWAKTPDKYISGVPSKAKLVERKQMIDEIYKMYKEIKKTDINSYGAVDPEEWRTPPQYCYEDELKDMVLLLKEELTNLTKPKTLHSGVKNYSKSVNKKFKVENKDTNIISNNSNDNSINDNNSVNNDNDNSVNKNMKNNEALDVSQIEAIPKKLAEQGDRPSDDKPVEQAIYDLQLITGFGPKNAASLAKEGCTLEILFNDWNKYLSAKPRKHNILDIDKLPIPEEYKNDIDAFNELRQVKQENLKLKELHDRMSNYSDWLPKLNHHQLIGIKYFKDIAEKIPRNEVEKIEKYLKRTAKAMSEDFIIGCCGSYRRGRDRSGDADSLLVHKKLKTKEDIKKYEEVHGSVLSIFINKLKELNFISDSLTDGGSTKYMGLCRLKNTSKNKYTLYRRLDVRFVPYNSYGAALLYFTGSKDHNVIMRNQAISMGLTLSEYGLFKGKKKDQKEQIPTISEEDVFKILKMEYKNPKERDI